MGEAAVPSKTEAPADLVVRRLLRIPDGPPTVGQDAAHRIFSTSMALSGLRCLLGYVVLPIVTPALGAAAGVGPVVGIPIAVVALVFDVRGIRRFWLADHRWRWPITAVYLMVMGLVASLLAGDVSHLV